MTLLLRSVVIAVALFGADAGMAKGKITHHELKVGETTRKYMVYRPNSVPRTKPAKAVFAFHGFMSDPAGLRWLTKPDKWADEHQYLMIYPSALKGSFNAGKGSGSRQSTVDELAFIDALLKRATGMHKADPRRLYALGFSNGAQMAALAMCKRSSVLAGVAMVAHSLNIQDCKPSVGVPAVVLRGAKDPFVPFGGGGKYGLRSHVDTIKTLRKFLGLTSEKNDITLDKPTIRCRDYPARATSRLRTCVGFNDGHTWPGGLEFQPQKFGKTNKELSGYDSIFKFFDQQKPSPGPAKVPQTTKVAQTSRPGSLQKKSASKPVVKRAKTAVSKAGRNTRTAETSRQSTRGQVSIPVYPDTNQSDPAINNPAIWYQPRG